MRIAAVAVALSAVALLVFTGCSNGQKHAEYDMLQSGSISQSYAEGEELFCLCNSREEAESIAEQYGIQLVNYDNGVAVFHTEENPADVINRGKEQGLPLLEINGVVHAAG